jgi:MFS family permease
VAAGERAGVRAERAGTTPVKRAAPVTPAVSVAALHGPDPEAAGALDGRGRAGAAVAKPGAEPGAAGLPVRRAVRYGAMPLVALAATMALTSGETSSLSQAVDGIKQAFHVSDTLVGFLPFAVAVVGVLGAVPFGILADRTRRTLVLAGAMAMWTAFMGLNGLAWGFWVLLGFRIGVGFAEASGSAAVSLVSDYYPVAQRAAKMGWYQLGAILGSLVGFVVGGAAVSLGGWRWAFWFWVPIGLATVAFLVVQPEPRRGDQEADFEAERAAAKAARERHRETIVEAHARSVPEVLADRLPPPRRTGTLDYEAATLWEVVRELARIPSMWWALLSITVAQAIASALSFWTIPYFERVDHLSAVGAGLFAGLLLPSAVAGVLGGGILADRLLARGVLCARIYVVVAGAIVSSVALPVAFATRSLVTTGVMLVVGGAAITVPIGPSEALFNDVVVAELRGRAASVRSIVRALSSIGPFVVGALADVLGGASTGLAHALMLFAPICGAGGVAFVLARRSYGADVAFVCAETVRVRQASGRAGGRSPRPSERP